MRACDNIQKIATGQGDDYTNGCLLYYNYFTKHYKMITIDLSRLQALDAGSKAIQQINFTGNLYQPDGAIIFLIIEEKKETVLEFSQGTVKVLFFVVFLRQNQYKMTQYNTLNVKLSNSQPNEIKSGIKNGTEATLEISSNVVGDSNDENNFPHKSFLTNTQVPRIHKALANNSSANVKLSKTQLHKIGHSE